LSNRKQIAWRRNKTEDLLIKGNSQIQIAQILHVSEGTVSNDVAYLREQSRKNIENHLRDRLPREYDNCISGINQILKMSWDIATRDFQAPSINANFSDNDNMQYCRVDDKTKLQALALANDCYKYKMELVTNGAVVSEAVKFVLRKNEEVQKMAEGDMNKTDQSATASQDLKSIGCTTTNKIF
jgi:hypothetical protein